MIDGSVNQPNETSIASRFIGRPFVMKLFLSSLILVCLVGVYSVFSWAMGDLYGYKVRYALERWQDTSVLPQLQEVSDVLADSNRALSWEARNPEYVELKGRVLYYRALALGLDDQGLVDISRAKTLHQQALELRPRWPYSWANLVLMKSYLKEFDEEYHQALINSLKFGPWEKSVHLTLSHAAALSWRALSLEQKRLFAKNIERGIVRNMPEIRSILSVYNRKSSICAYLKRDPIQNKLCSA
ncbi:hypothetical protein [Neptuniibacter marinus]|uniref:hypothetical protein n=1 Tax=Neptuniibacter marinus TaxID=1806670 RepID=UPI00082A791F|nr:hypothetical protein [Neptuniibacter marinus]